MYSIEIKDKKEIYDFCMLNGITDINKFIQDCFKQGFDIKKYGLIGDNTEKIIEYVDKEIPIEVIKYVEKEVIKEIPIEVIKEVEKEVVQTVYIEKEVPIEKIVEITKEIPIYITGETQTIEKIVEKIKEVEVIKEVEKPNEKMGMLQETLMKLRREIGDKDKTITELNNKIEQLEKLVSNTGAVYMKGSNLNQNL